MALNKTDVHSFPEKCLFLLRMVKAFSRTVLYSTDGFGE